MLINIKTEITRLLRRIKRINISSFKIPNPILFPWPIKLLQKKLWTIYWVEWSVILFGAGMFFGTLSGADAVLVPIVGGLIMTFGGAYFIEWYLRIAKWLRGVTKLYAFKLIADVSEWIFRLLYWTNYSIISKFSEEKLPGNRLKKYKEGGRWNP